MKCLLSLVFIALLFGTSSHVAAKSELEIANLKRVVEEIKLAKKIALEAKGHASQSDEVKFQYDKLILDLTQIEAAIERHIIKPSTAPRKVEELYTDYVDGS